MTTSFDVLPSCLLLNSCIRASSSLSAVSPHGTTARGQLRPWPGPGAAQGHHRAESRLCLIGRVERFSEELKRRAGIHTLFPSLLSLFLVSFSLYLSTPLSLTLQLSSCRVDDRDYSGLVPSVETPHLVRNMNNVARFSFIPSISPINFS